MSSPVADPANDDVPSVQLSRAREMRALTSWFEPAEAVGVIETGMRVFVGSGAAAPPEYGIASLHGKTVKKRVEALIAIAHPTFREELARGARARHWA